MGFERLEREFGMGKRFLVEKEDLGREELGFWSEKRDFRGEKSGFGDGI